MRVSLPLSALLLGIWASAAASSAPTHVVLQVDEAWAMRGQFEGSCAANGAVLPPAGTLDLDFQEARLGRRESTLHDPPLPKEAHSDGQHVSSSEWSSGRIRLDWHPAGRTVLFTSGGDRPGPDPFSVAFEASNMSGARFARAVPTGTDFKVVEGTELVTESGFLRNWSLMLALDGSAAASGDFALYLREATLVTPTAREVLPAYRTEEPGEAPTTRHIILRDAWLDLRGARTVLPSGSQLACRDLRGHLVGAFHAASGRGFSLSDRGLREDLEGPLHVEGPMDVAAQAPQDRGFEHERRPLLVQFSGAASINGRALVTPSPASPTVWPYGVFLGAALGLFAAVRNAGLLVGLFYSRFGRDRALENSSRELVFRAVWEQPGIDLSTLGAVTGFHLTTVSYHVQVLERVGLVSTMRQGRARRILPRARSDAAAKVAVVLEHDPRFAFLAGEVRAGPRPVSDLVRRLRARFGLRRRGAYAVISRAESHGVLVRESDGKRQWARFGGADIG